MSDPYDWPEPNRVYKVSVDLKGKEIDTLYMAIQEFHYYLTTQVEDHQRVARLYNCIDAIDKVVEAAYNRVHDTHSTKTVSASRLEGEKCGEGNCGHSSNIHSGGKGLCSSESCPCMKFEGTGRYL
jgi:hypothetical protein